MSREPTTLIALDALDAEALETLACITLAAARLEGTAAACRGAR